MFLKIAKKERYGSNNKVFLNDKTKKSAALARYLAAFCLVALHKKDFASAVMKKGGLALY